MKEEVTVTDSEHGFIPEGATLEIENSMTNQFNGRKTLRVRTDADVPSRTERFTLFQMPDDSSWTEVHVGLSREHESVKLE
jgi:hypothetical protein